MKERLQDHNQSTESFQLQRQSKCQPWQGLERVQTKGELLADVNPLRYVYVFTLNIQDNDTQVYSWANALNKDHQCFLCIYRACVFVVYNAFRFFPSNRARGDFAERD